MSTSWDTWRCHICGDERPDACISVFKRQRTLEGGALFTENIRFCNDRDECVQAARHHTNLKPKATTPGDKHLPAARSHGYEMGAGLVFIGLLGIILILWWLLG